MRNMNEMRELYELEIMFVLNECNCGVGAKNIEQKELWWQWSGGCRWHDNSDDTSFCLSMFFKQGSYQVSVFTGKRMSGEGPKLIIHWSYSSGQVVKPHGF